MKILLVDDEDEKQFLLKTALSAYGHEFRSALSGREALHLLQAEVPDVILLDLNMPGMDGHETCRRIRMNHRLEQIPVIILTASDAMPDKISSFDEGADEYLTKAMDPLEMEKRIQAVVRRYQQNMDRNPLTGLPGNNAIVRWLNERLQAAAVFAAVYTDLDNFKAYNDHYSFLQGDQVIRFTAETIRDVLEQAGSETDQAGHIGGDDFIFITEPQRPDELCREIIRRFDSGIRQFYSEEDLKRGGILARDRQGSWQNYPLISLSMAVVSNQFRLIHSAAEVAAIAGELKKQAKKIPGSVFVNDQRVD